MSIIKNEKITSKLIAAIVFVSLAVIFGLLIIIPVKYYIDSERTPDDLIGITYTYQSCERTGGKSSHYEIMVNEESKPLRIQRTYIPAVNQQNLSSLKNGDTIRCYVITSENDDFAYDIAEMYRGPMPILTLQDFNSEGKQNAIIGLVILPIISVAFIAGAIYEFTVYSKRSTK